MTGRIDPGNRTYEVTGLTAGTAYEIRVRMDPIPGVDTLTYQYGYATIYTDDCDTVGADTCTIGVNQAKKGRINHHTSDDIDGHIVRLTSGRTYVIKVNGKSSRNGTLVDPSLILTADNVVIANDDNGGRRLNAKLTYTPTTTGDFNIQVSSNVAGERGSYRVKVTEK